MVPDIKPKKIFITSFEPFGGRNINASTEVVKALDGYQTFYLPVVWDKIFYMLKSILDLKPDYLILTGEASMRDKVMVEALACNLADGKDNEGKCKTKEKIFENGKDILKTTVDLTNVNIEISNDAGSYLCNYSYYCALSLATNQNCKCAFVHFPLIKEEGGSYDVVELKEIFSLFLKNCCV